MKALLGQIAYGFAALLLFVLLSTLASFAAAPVGGGEYHLIFAYSDSGRLETALYVYAVLVSTLAAVCSALLWLSYPLGWVPLCILASAVGLHRWWGIATWERTSPEFRAVALGATVVDPTVDWPCRVVGSGAAHSHSGRCEKGHRSHPPA